MKFTQYPRKEDRRNRNNGEVREGSIWSAAPGGVWIAPAERRPMDPATCLLGHKGRGMTGDEYFVITAEQENGQ